MSAEEKNLCHICNVGQKCCRELSGLKVTRQEFEKLFKEYSYRLSVLKYKKFFIVSTKKGLPCPHWEETGCKVYQERPIDCRLFPYEFRRVLEKRKAIEVAFHGKTDCPHKEGLFIPLEEAKDLMNSFCRSVYGEGKPINIKYLEELKTPSGVYRLFAPVMARLSKILRAHR